MLLLLFHRSTPLVGPDSDQYERYIRVELPRITLSTNIVPASPRPSQE